ncbi:MAG: diguanylate phosphodiesterase, partial [Anaerolineae bacterium]|nr:diguanylate phosphodiesterase [Anaerolineae bacterium]
KSMATLISLATMQEKPVALMTLALTRAKMCELLATHSEPSLKDVGFTVGLFSALDALLDMTMEQVLENLPVSEQIQQALLHHEGLAGHLLDCILAY